MDKRMNIKTLLAALLLALSLISCETIIDYRGPETEPKTVIYALLHPDSLVSVSIAESRSVFIVPWQPRQIPDAVVRLYRDGEFLETLTYKEPDPLPDYSPPNPYSKYVSNTVKPEFGHVYRIEAEVKGYRKAFGETMLPSPVAAEVTDTSSKDAGYGYREMTVRFTFRDPAGEENYYRVSANSLQGTYYGEKQAPYDPQVPVTVQKNDISYGAMSDPLIAPRQEDDFFEMYMPNRYYLFMDELISGKEYTLKLTYNGFYPRTDYYEFLHAWFRLNAITRDLYLYLQSYTAYLQANDNFLAEPVPVYTNVTGGLGVVGAMSTFSDSIKIGEYPVEGVPYDRWPY